MFKMIFEVWMSIVFDNFECFVRRDLCMYSRIWFFRYWDILLLVQRYWSADWLYEACLYSFADRTWSWSPSCRFPRYLHQDKTVFFWRAWLPPYFSERCSAYGKKRIFRNGDSDDYSRQPEVLAYLCVKGCFYTGYGVNFLTWSSRWLLWKRK